MDGWMNETEFFWKMDGDIDGWMENVWRVVFMDE